jgi:hypothetical protein
MPVLCPSCGAHNQAGALFCLDCGDPLDAPASLAEPAGRGRGRDRGLRPALLGALAIPALVALALLTAWGGTHDRQQSAYARARADLTAHHWDSAVANFRIAGDYADAAQQLRAATTTRDALDALDTVATRAEQRGAWWDAAGALRDLATRDPLWPRVTERLAAAQRAIGTLVYRVPRGPDAGLWWAYADGSDPHRFPAGLNASIHGISPDGRWVVSSIYTFYPWPPSRHALSITDLQSGATTSVPLPPIGEPDARSVRFRADGQGFWWVVDNRWAYYDFAARRLTWLSARPLAADTRHGRLLIGRQMEADPGVTRTVLLLADALGAPLRDLRAEPGTVEQAQFSPDGDLLSYQVRSSLSGSTVDTLIIVGLDLPVHPPMTTDTDRYLTVDFQVSAAAGAPARPFTEVFLPLAAPNRYGHVVSAPDAPLLLVGGPDEGPDLFPADLLGLGPRVRVTGMRATYDGAYQALRAETPAGATVDWLQFCDQGRFALYLQARPRGELTLFSAPVAAGGTTGASPGAAVPLLARAGDLHAWTHNTALTHDGTRVLALRGRGEVTGSPMSPPSAAGLWAVRPDGTDPRLLIPDVTEFWTADGWLVGP